MNVWQAHFERLNEEYDNLGKPRPLTNRVYAWYADHTFKYTIAFVKFFIWFLPILVLLVIMHLIF